MIRPKKYLPARSKIFYSPLIKENLRLEFSSLEYKLDDLSLLTALMLRDGKSADDISAVTLLSRPVIENVLSVLKSQGLIDEHNECNLPKHTRKILELSDCINFFNVNTPPIFSDVLKSSPVILSQSTALKSSGDDTTCAATVKNCEQISTADFEDISSLVKNFLRGHGAGDFLDEIKILRLEQRAEVLFAARELYFLPVVGENNFSGCIYIDSERTINAELPVRKFKLNDGREFNVDLLLGTIFLAENDEETDSEEILLSFKPSPDYTGDKLTKKIFDTFMGNIEDKGVYYLKMSVSEKVAGDFLCE